MYRIFFIILLSVSLLAQTNQKPWRVFLSNGKVVVSNGKVLNHQTYIATRTADTASGAGGFYLRVEQTNNVLASSMDDFNGYFSSITDADLFRAETNLFSDRFYISKGGAESVPAGGSRHASYSYYVSTHGAVVDSTTLWDLVGVFGVPMIFFQRPSVPYSELASVDIDSSAGALVSMVYADSSSDPLYATNALAVAGDTIDATTGFRAAIAGWRNVSYEATRVYDNDFTTNGVDPVTHEAWSISSGLHERTEDIILPFGWESPVDSVIWRFNAIKEYY